MSTERTVSKESNMEISEQATTSAQGNTGRASTKESSEPPTKQKRTHSEVSEASLEELSFIHDQLETLSTEMKDTRDSIKNLMTKDDIQSFISQTVQSVMNQMEEKLTKIVDEKVKEKNEDLNNRLDYMVFENGEIKDRLDKVEKELKGCQEQLGEEKTNTQTAIQKSNYNEQYSRKNNVKVMGIQETENESEQNLMKEVISLVRGVANVNIEPYEIMAIHRIPSKNEPKPVLMKLRNNSVKTRLMKQRRIMKQQGHKLVDDVTKLNTGLISRLQLHEKIDSAWFFNGAIYGKTTEGRRHKFDLFNDINKVIDKVPATNNTPV